jgi:hypothetical protein
MEKQVKVWQVIVALLALGTSWVAAYVNIKQTQAVHDSKISKVEQTQTEMQNTQRLSEATQYTRHSELIRAINELRIIVENKQNRQ